jgi:CheY-like chemotaxis protein/HPt (histidine-containing phosphotransfer) domain-containing protein
MPNETKAIPEGMSVSEWEALQELFLEQGIARSVELLAGLEKHFDGVQIARQMHEWAGSAGQLGYHGITKLARQAEQLLRDVPVRKSDLRRSLTDLLLAFSELRDSRIGSVPHHVAEALSGKRVALIGLRPDRADRACQALARVNAKPRIFSATDDLESEPVCECDLVVVQVGPETVGARLQAAVEGSAAGKLFLAGEHEYLMALPPAVQALVVEYLADNWEPGEMLLRLTLAVLRKATAASVPAPASEVIGIKAVPDPWRLMANPRVLIVDDDPIILSLVRTTLRNFGMQCETANNGGDALRLIRGEMPQVVVLDVNMPGMDGYGVLSAIRAEDLPVLVVMLTARQQENDVLRGFRLGADDYLTKPFNPQELVARIKRLLRQTARAAA